ncbi:hypothetical protein AKO1_010723 [Acrasis kona]|uniref:Peptidase C14 caspase domain-containing protein n=1 Tax=Acrasis kona TaxID=1008807 RepID=A0AAW2YPM7_9EUKA
MALSRITNLIKHIKPFHYDRSGPSIQNIKDTTFHHVLCLGFTGNTHHLKIANAVAHSEQFHENQYLQRSLLNSNNDVLNIINFISKLAYPISFSVNGHVTAKNVKHVLKESFITTSDSNNKGIILYWSGHGKAVESIHSNSKELYLSMAKSSHNDTSEELVCLNKLISYWHSLQPVHPLFLILECCHSGLAVVEGLGTWGTSSTQPCLILTSCAAEDVSGGWIMDGANTGGILTNFLIDPIATYFKVIFNVFYEFGGDIFSNNPMKSFYDVFSYHIDNIIDDCDLRQDFIRLQKIAGSHVVVLFKHFMLLVRYGNKLYHPQDAKSFPDVSKCRDSEHWTLMEQEFEELILDLWSKMIPEQDITQ